MIFLKSFFVTILLVLTLFANAQDGGSFKPYGKPVFLVFSDVRNSFSNEGNSTAFEISRLYLGYEHFFSERFSARANIDIGDPGTGNLQMTAYVKNAYLQYKFNGLTAKFGMITTDQFNLIDRQWGYRYQNNHTVISKRFLTTGTFVLRLTREGLMFRAGQRILAGLKDDIDQRDYSVYSGEYDDYLEILVKEIDEGNVSVKLKNCEPGHLLNISGPYGSFTITENDRRSAKLVFIATGTGISPFHSFVRTYAEIDYLLIHGIRYKHEAYDSDQYEPGKYIICTSREETAGKKERVTGFISGFRITPGMLFYLCGNGSMIYDVSRILLRKGVSEDRIFSEIYFA